jgi:hypothetical protein
MLGLDDMSFISSVGSIGGSMGSNIHKKLNPNHDSTKFNRIVDKLIKKGNKIKGFKKSSRS